MANLKANGQFIASKFIEGIHAPFTGGVNVANVVMQSGTIPANGVMSIPYPSGIVAGDELLVFIQRDYSGGGSFFGTGNIISSGFTNYGSSITKYTNSNFYSKGIDIFKKTASGTETGFIQAASSTINPAYVYIMSCIHIKNANPTISCANAASLSGNYASVANGWMPGFVPPPILNRNNQKVIVVSVCQSGSSVSTANAKTVLDSEFTLHANTEVFSPGFGNNSMAVFSKDSAKSVYIPASNVFSGNGVITAPENVDSAILLIWGGGGGGAWNAGATGARAGGGGGFLIKKLNTIGGKTKFYYDIGTGGIGAGSGSAANGQNGIATTVIVDGITYTANGGDGGNYQGSGGVGGTISVNGDSDSSNGTLGALDSTGATTTFGGKAGASEFGYGGGTSNAAPGGGGSMLPSINPSPGGKNGSDGAMKIFWTANRANTYLELSGGQVQTLFSFVYSPSTPEYASYYANNAFRGASLVESTSTVGKLHANGQIVVSEFVEE